MPRYLPLDDRLYRYVLEHSVREHAVMAELREETSRIEHGGMQIGPDQGALMQMLVRLAGARRCIEVGVFTGYSALAVALALPADGAIVACDVSPEWTAIARRYWQRAGVADRIDLRLAPAGETLAGMLAAGESGTYDFAFIDADKTGYRDYYEKCLQLLRPGGLIVVDNTLWSGEVADPGKQGRDTRALREFNDALHRDERVDLALLALGDGVTLARKR
jgi:predicted O-methyltransferase YrrM